MFVTRESSLTGKMHTWIIDGITPYELEAWDNGQYMRTNDLIQRTFPNLSADEREFILTGITPEEWNAYMGEDE